MSDGTRQSILALVIGALGVITLLSFFNLAGNVGSSLDDWIALVFGFSRPLISLILLVIAWDILLPHKQVLRIQNSIGLILFVVSFNGLLNLFMLDASTPLQTQLSQAGGYVGLFTSYTLAGWLGFWGTLFVAFVLLCVSIILIFNISLQAILSAPEHFSDLKTILTRDGEENEKETEFSSDIKYDENVNIEDGKLKKRILPDQNEEPEEESIMTSTRRRKMEIPLDILRSVSSDARAGDIDRSQEIIRRTFENFGIVVEMVGVKVGPTVTQYAIRPAEGIKLSRIVALQDDLALALAAHPIRIEAPIPGKSLVGIEVPNQKIGQVSLRELLESETFKKRKTNFTAPLGKDVSGDVQMVEIDKAPHMLVAGATGSGKSVCLNNVILSLMYQNGPDDLKFIMVDPKRVELGVYAGIPHLLVPPITKVEEAINALKWAVREMERRLDHLAKSGSRDIDAYNAKTKERMPKVIIIIDELADLMSQNKRDVEAVIVRIAQMARAVGIHLVLATQRPSVDVITGLIKANIPTRLAFAVASQVDSKTILDQAGADKLLGRGDMLMMSPRISKPRRCQGAYISDKEIEAVVHFLKSQGIPDYNYQITEDMRTGGSAFLSEDSDTLLEDAIQVVIESDKASTSLLQRRLKIGYSRAARIVDIMEEMGVIGVADGARPREVLIDEWPVNGTKHIQTTYQLNSQDEVTKIEDEAIEEESVDNQTTDDIIEDEEIIEDYEVDEIEDIESDEEFENDVSEVSQKDTSRGNLRF